MGFFKIDKSLLEHTIWTCEPFSKGQAFVDMIGRANFRDEEKIIGNKVSVIKRGQFPTSEQKLAQRWQWSRNKVRAYLKLLENMEMITTEGTTVGTIITIENYSKYQSEQPTQGTAVGTAQGTAQGTAVGTAQGTLYKNNRTKEHKNNNNIYITHGQYNNVKLTAEDLESLMKEFPLDYQDRIERLSEYIASSGKKYKNHLATIRAWARKEKPKKQEKPKTKYNVGVDI